MCTGIEIAKLILSIVIPIAIVFLGYFINLRLKRIDQNNEKRLRQENELQEQQRAKLERRDKYRIEFSLNASVIGRQKAYYLVEFTITINNKSLLKKDFTAINLRVRGLEENSDIELWCAQKNDESTKKLPEEKQTSRIKFPVVLFSENILPPYWENVFIEPGVQQDITFNTPIRQDISFILASVKFYYKNVPEPHTAERMFALKPPAGSA